MGSSNNIPDWLKTLLKENFFNTCQIHKASKKNELNMYCLDCCSSFCRNCMDSHASHCHFQIFRNNKNDSVHVDDLKKQTNCASIQVYKCNSEDVVYLNSRKSSHSEGLGNNQCFCGHTLPEAYLYCSLSCKVNHSVTNETSSSNKGKKNRRKGTPHRSPLF